MYSEPVFGRHTPEASESVENDFAWCLANAEKASDEETAYKMKAYAEAAKLAGNIALAIGTLGTSTLAQVGVVVADVATVATLATP